LSVDGPCLLKDGGEGRGGVVNLLLLVTAPEISVGKLALVVAPFHPLGDVEIE
jgi:hypothetical protein